MLARRYLDKGLELLQRLQDTHLENIEQAAELIAQAVADGHRLYAWGGPPTVGRKEPTRGQSIAVASLPALG